MVCLNLTFGITHCKHLLTMNFLQSDKVRQQQLYQVMKQKHVGLGNDDTNRDEWMTNVHRDTYNSILGHSGLLEYVSLASGDHSKRTTKLEIIDKMCNEFNKRKLESR